jgi:BirA family biotin operon repressor/biotin-[acetyl-CoA-carboxylase] ligase
MIPLIPLSPAGIAAGLTDAHASVCVRVYDSIDSTNTEARRLIDARRAGRTEPLPVTLLAARSQTAGRGRLGRSFYSPMDSGLYMTLLYPLTQPLSQAVAVTAGAAVATLEAIRAVTGLVPGIKWVNDLYMNGKKICGILTEAVTPASPAEPAYMLVGIGVNLTTAAFPEGLRAPAGSLTDSLSPSAALPALDAGRLCGQIAHRLLTLLETDSLRSPKTLAAYRAHSILLGKPVLCTRGGQSFPALAVDISSDPAFGLSVRREDGRMETLDSGEVSVSLHLGKQEETPR